MRGTIITEDFEKIVYNSDINWKQLKNKTVLVTGATGEIGKALIKALVYANSKLHIDINVVAAVRDINKASTIFSHELKYEKWLSFVEADVENFRFDMESVDYIVHGASPTKGEYFINYPVETIWTNVQGTRRMLEFAKNKGASAFVFLSSMEIYGGVADDTVIVEECGTSIDTMRVRNCYPESKRLGEALCAAYCKEYGLATKVIRLAQTFGAGMSNEETRVYAQFVNAVLRREDIILHTKGTSCRGYLYISDAVSGILKVLLCGDAGEAYNAVNEKTYCSIYEMAVLVANRIANGEIRVVVKEDLKKKSEYPPTGNLRLSSAKLRALGWNPTVGLEEMYIRTISEKLEEQVRVCK